MARLRRTGFLMLLLLFTVSASALGPVLSVEPFIACRACRARVELKVIDTATERIIASSSAYAGASGLGTVVAGKKAIQKAAAQLPAICRAVTEAAKK